MKFALDFLSARYILRRNFGDQRMKFTLNHAPAFMGNDISVHVEADEGNTIQHVVTELDGLVLADDLLSTPTDSYDRVFSRAGHASPGIEHTLLVSVEQDDSKTHSATSIWID